MKNKVYYRLLSLAMVLVLCAGCSAYETTESEQSFSEQEPSVEVLPELPSEYTYKNGKCYLYLGLKGGDDDGNYVFFSSADEMKQKFLNLSFTQEELESFDRLLDIKAGFLEVLDPRYLYPLNLPQGVSEQKVEFGVFPHSADGAVRVHFKTTCSETFDQGTAFDAKMHVHGTVGNAWIDHQIKSFIDSKYYSTKYSLVEEITLLDGTKGLCLMTTSSCEYSNGKTVYNGQNTKRIRYIQNDGKRDYYIEEYFEYDVETGTQLLNKTITASVYHQGIGYTYSITDPTDECAKNIVEYDPFTYAEIA